MKKTKPMFVIVLLAALGYGAWYANRKPSKAKKKRPPAPIVDAKAKAILEHADAVAPTVTSYSYEAQYTERGKEEQQTGSVRMDRSTNRLRITVAWHGEEPSQDKQYEIATDGVTIYERSDADRLYLHGPFPQYTSLLEPGKNLLMSELGGFHPFREALQGTSRYEGKKSIHGQMCDVVYVEHRRAGQHTRWYFGTDGMARQAERFSNAFADIPEEKQIVKTLTLTNLRIDPPQPQSGFQVSRPQGYEDVSLPAFGSLLTVGSQAPDWKLKTPQGKTVTLADLRGQVVVMDFWATWCGPCKAGMPYIQKLHERFADRPVRLFGIDCQDPGGDPASYMTSQHYTYTTLLDGDEVAQAYHVAALPTLYVIDSQGNVAFASMGQGPEEWLDVVVERLIPKERTVSRTPGS